MSHLGRGAVGIGWGKHEGVQQGGDETPADAEHCQRRAPADRVDEPAAERSEDGARQSAGDGDDRECAVTATRVEGDKHRHRRLVERGCHRHADHDPRQVQHHWVGCGGESEHPERADDRSCREDQPRVEPGEGASDRWCSKPGDQEAERERTGDNAVGPAGVIGDLRRGDREAIEQHAPRHQLRDRQGEGRSPQRRGPPPGEGGVSCSRRWPHPKP